MDLLEESRDTDLLIERLVYGRRVEHDQGGEWRIVPEAEGRQLRQENPPAVPHYSSDPKLAEQAFLAALAMTGRNRQEFELVCPEGLYGDAWGIREADRDNPLATAASEAVLFCRAAIEIVRRHGQAAP